MCHDQKSHAQNYFCCLVRKYLKDDLILTVFQPSRKARVSTQQEFYLARQECRLERREGGNLLLSGTVILTQRKILVRYLETTFLNMSTC